MLGDWRDLIFGKADQHPEIPGYDPRRHNIESWEVVLKTETLWGADGEPRTVERTEQHFKITDKSMGGVFGGLMSWT